MRERCLKDLELYVYTLRHAVVDRLNNSRDRREEDDAQGDGALEGAESNADNFGIFRWAAPEDRDGTGEVFHMLATVTVIIGKSRNSHIHTQLIRPVLV